MTLAGDRFIIERMRSLGDALGRRLCRLGAHHWESKRSIEDHARGYPMVVHRTRCTRAGCVEHERWTLADAHPAVR